MLDVNQKNFSTQFQLLQRFSYFSADILTLDCNNRKKRKHKLSLEQLDYDVIPVDLSHSKAARSCRLASSERVKDKFINSLQFIWESHENAQQEFIHLKRVKKRNELNIHNWHYAQTLGC